MRLLSRMVIVVSPGDEGRLPQELTTKELEYLVGVTSPLQSQIAGKAELDHTHTGVYEPANEGLLDQSDIPYIALNGGYF